MKRIFLFVSIFTAHFILNAQCWKQVSAGSLHALAIKEDNTLWAWGSNLLGALGDGSNNDSDHPIQISNLQNWKMVSAGKNFSLALKNDGTIWARGNNDNFQCGDTFLASQIISYPLF